MLELLVLAIAPALFILLYMYRKDRYEPEPLHLIVGVFFLGALTVVPAGLLELLFPKGVISSAIAAPVIEEALKFLVVLLVVYRHTEFDEPMDGIVYATAASLGFATIENILYVIEGGFVVGIVRAIASVPGHVVFSCVWGFALGTAKFRPATERNGIILTGLFGGILLHGIFNFSLEVFAVAGFLLVLLVIIPLGWWMTCRNIGCAHADPASACSLANRREVLSVTQGSKHPCVAPDQSAYPAPSRVPDTAGAAPGKNGADAMAGIQRFCTHCGAPRREGILFCENCGKEF